ncbi:U11/U12 small nuclear ribonucleoprotein 48 kDa protein [Gastrophryne carolinensis]
MEVACNRLRLLQELKEFTERCRSRLTDVLQEWGWEEEEEEEEEAGKQQEMAVCPYDSNHRMPSSCLEKHISVCKLWQQGYSKEETKLYDPQYFYEKASVPCIILDKAMQFQVIKEAKDKAPSASGEGSWDKSKSFHRLLGKMNGYIQKLSYVCHFLLNYMYSSSPVEVPLNHKRAICDLLPGDRLAIFDYVLQRTKVDKSVKSFNEADLFEDLTAKIKNDDDLKCPKSHLEIMAEMRDYKRRRQSYRAKNVHITKKSYTEIIRDVIEVHMEELCSSWHDEASSSVSSSSNKRRKQQRSPSVESRKSGGGHGDRHRSGRKRHRSRSSHRQQSRDKSSRHKKERQDIYEQLKFFSIRGPHPTGPSRSYIPG